MRRFAPIFGCALTIASLGLSAQNTQPAPQQNIQQQKTAASRPRRVHAKLDGFELASGAAPANQIGGASRGFGGVTLYAPRKALVYTLHPVFYWGGITSNTRYVFRLMDMRDETIFQTEVTGDSLAYPASAPTLIPGKTYSWTVQPRLDMLGGPAPPAMIVIADATKRQQIADAIAQTQGADLGAALKRAQIFTDDRLWYDAIDAYTQLIRQYPDQKQLYDKRGTIYEQIPATQKLADADFEKAS